MLALLLSTLLRLQYANTLLRSKSLGRVTSGTKLAIPHRSSVHVGDTTPEWVKANYMNKPSTATYKKYYCDDRTSVSSIDFHGL